MNNIAANKTSKMLLATEEEIFIKLIEADHPFRYLNEHFNFIELTASLAKCYSELGTTGIAAEKGFKALLVQFWEDYSDRDMEKCLRENIAVRWFCGFGLMEDTPDHSYFGKLRKRIGPSRLAEIFNKVNEAMKKKNLFGEVFTFIDASSIITKIALWEERDRAIEEGKKKLNNAIVSDYAADQDAKWGAKSKTNIWFGYKRHNAVDMRYGLINKVAVTPANVPDYKAVKNIVPRQGLVFLDKGYDYKEADIWIKANGGIPATLRKNNNKQKNHDLDRWHSCIRMPFENTFSKQSKRAKYRGLTKVLFQCFAEAIAHNFKKAINILPRLAKVET
ncbi:MAG: transposase [Candidatus Magasanikbacteria bacterium]|nr:transposase [Candidatus Magasanikbacteria bacterium]